MGEQKDLNEINQLEILKEYINEDYKTVLEYEGVFSKPKIYEFAVMLNKLTMEYPAIQKKMFYVFIELAQNVSMYSDLKGEISNGKNTGKGAVIVGYTDKEYFFIIGNVVNNKALQVLIKKCEIINSLDKESLRLFKRQQRNLIPGTSGGAHIGLIMVALTTRKKLDIKIKPLGNDYSFFMIKVAISKSDTPENF